MAHFVEQWEEFTDNKWFLSIIQHGFRIPFSKIPPLSSVQNESILLPINERRDQNPSQQMGSGQGTESRNSRLLFPDISGSKKERKVTFNYRPLSIEPIHRETVFSNRVSQVCKTVDELNNWAVSIDLTDAYLHSPIHPQYRKYLRL